MSVYDAKDLVSVIPYAGATCLYGFRTNVDPTTRTQLGHTPVPSDYPDNLVIGANFPKPPKATRPRGAASDRAYSSWCSADKVAEARTLGWSVKAGKKLRGYPTTLSRIAYVTVNGFKFAWRMPKYQYDKIFADLPSLGVSIASGNDNDLVLGAEYPIIPRAQYILSPNTSPSTTKVRVDPSRIDNLPDGWTKVGGSTEEGF